MEQFVDGVTLLPLMIANAYLVGEADSGAWIVVDSGMAGHFDAIKDAAAERFGVDARPAAIVLTHGHPDHSGSALALAAYWNVKIYVHPLELPFLTGRAPYPPADPTIGGFLGFAGRFAHDKGADFGDFVAALPADHSVPGIDGWRWIESPGHSPGHVSLFRESDRTLLAGDAVITVDSDDFVALLRRTNSRVSRPPASSTYNWLQVRKSMQSLAALRPVTLATGHGAPIQADDLAEDLRRFANDFLPPLHGRYVADPATFDENGVVYLPPPAPDPLPKAAAGIAIALAVAGGIYAAMKYQKNKRNA